MSSSIGNPCELRVKLIVITFSGFILLSFQNLLPIIKAACFWFPSAIFANSCFQVDSIRFFQNCIWLYISMSRFAPLRAWPSRLRILGNLG